MTLSARLFKSSLRWEGALVVVLFLEIAVFGLLQPRFLNFDRLLASTADFAYLGIIALPLAIVMMTGGIDISIGSIVSLSSICTGISYQLGGNIWMAAAVGIAVAVLAGLVNGLAIVSTGAQPMVITLGSQFLFAGLALGVSGLVGVSSFEGIAGFPDDFVELSNGTTLGLPNMLLIFLALAGVFAVLLHKTAFGRRVRLLGANARAARYSGFKVHSITIRTYLLSALGAGIAGVLLTSYVASARADIGANVLLPVLTLVVIGGVSMFGGEGTLVGVILATFVIGYLQQGLRFMGMTESEVAVATGTALIVVASLRWWTARGAEHFRNRRVRRQHTSQQSTGGFSSQTGTAQPHPSATHAAVSGTSETAK